MNRTIQHIDQLLKRCKANDSSAQMEVYKRYYKAMYNTALRIVKDSYSAEDIMQESFLIAFTKLDSFKGEVAFGAWLKKIVINNSLQAYKKSSKLEHYPIEKEIWENTVADENAEELNKIKVEEVLFAISRLNERDRIALSLYLIEGYDYEEISEIMDLSNNNCRTIISRAKSKLKNQILMV